MKTFIMMMGISGSGKSTFIKENNLENYTVNPDTLRKATGGLSTNPDGTKTTTQEFDSLIWPFIYDVLDRRMSKGMFTVFDATNCSQRTVQELLKHTKKYNYRTYVVDMMKEVTLEECKNRNKARPEADVVPDKVLDKQFANYQKVNLPSRVSVIEPSNFKSIFRKPMVLLQSRREET